MTEAPGTGPSPGPPWAAGASPGGSDSDGGVTDPSHQCPPGPAGGRRPSDAAARSHWQSRSVRLAPGEDRRGRSRRTRVARTVLSWPGPGMTRTLMSRTSPCGDSPAPGPGPGPGPAQAQAQSRRRTFRVRNAPRPGADSKSETAWRRRRRLQLRLSPGPSRREPRPQPRCQRVHRLCNSRSD